MAGTLTISTLSDGTNSTSSTNCIQGSAKAWGSYTGTGSTPTTRSAYNISSVTRNSTGNCTFSFTTALPTANYGAALSIPIGTAGNTATATVIAKTTSSFTAVTQYVSSLGGAGLTLDYNIDFIVFSL
jgi:hypothetical protein